MDHGHSQPNPRVSQPQGYDAERSNHSTGRGGGVATPNSGRGGGMAGFQGGSESQSWHRSRDEVFVPDHPPAYTAQDNVQQNQSSGYYAAAAAGASYSGEGRMPKHADASHYSNNTAEVSYHSNNPYQQGYIDTTAYNTHQGPVGPHPDDVGDAFGEDDHDAYAQDMAQRLEAKQNKAAKTSTIAIQTNVDQNGGRNTNGSSKGKNGDRSSQNLFVSGLPLTVNDAELRKMFDPFGTVSSAKVMLNIRTGVSRGFGFVMYSDPKEAEKALKGLHGTSPKGGQKLKITYSEHKGQNLNVESNKLYVRNIPSCSQLTNDELLNYFEKFGSISGLQCRNDPYQTNAQGGTQGRSDQISSGGSSSSPTGTPGVTSSGNGGTGSGTGSNQNNNTSTQNSGSGSGTGSGTGTGSRPNSAPGSIASDSESEKVRKSRRLEWEKALIPSGKAGQSAMRVLFIEYESATIAKACVDATHNSMPFLSCSTPLLAKIFEPQELRDQRLKEQSELKQRQKQSGRGGFSGKKGRGAQQQGQNRPQQAMQPPQQPQYAAVVQPMPLVQGAPFHQPAFPQQQPQFAPQYYGQPSAPYIQSMAPPPQFQQPAFVQQPHIQHFPQQGAGYPQQMMHQQGGGYQHGGPNGGRY